jgi:ABC-type Mn2+/Zn2+ transport system ATPase subunit
LLLDEPFSHIDKRISAVAMQLIVERAQQQSASVIATSLGDATFFESFERLYL